MAVREIPEKHIYKALKEGMVSEYELFNHARKKLLWGGLWGGLQNGIYSLPQRPPEKSID